MSALIKQKTIVDVGRYMHDLGRNARQAARVLAQVSRAQKDKALLNIAAEIRLKAPALVLANQADLEGAAKKGLSGALLERLELTPERIEAMAVGCEQVAALTDPVGEISELAVQPSGIQVGKMRVPLGVIGIVYESRPNVTVDAAILCLKSGNAAILRGGSESINSNQAIAQCIHSGLHSAGVPTESVQIVATTDRDAVGAMITMTEFVDVIVPRGGKSLIERISAQATVPTIKHLDGICHVYIDQAADYQKAYDIAISAKTHRYGVCNAMETLLIHRAKAESILAPICKAMISHGVELRVCETTRSMLEVDGNVDELVGLVLAATEEDWQTEYLAPILSIKIVDDADQAMEHIARYSSGHTEAIVTEDHSLAMRFLRQVDSSSVIVNASTRFADGSEFGLGAEIGISTDKLHVRGPVGLYGLTSQKYIVFGSGEIRQ